MRKPRTKGAIAALVESPARRWAVIPLKKHLWRGGSYHRTWTGTLLRHPHLRPHPHHSPRHISLQAQYAALGYYQLTGESREHTATLLQTALSLSRHAESMLGSGTAVQLHTLCSGSQLQALTKHCNQVLLQAIPEGGRLRETNSDRAPDGRCRVQAQRGQLAATLPGKLAKALELDFPTCLMGVIILLTSYSPRRGNK